MTEISTHKPENVPETEKTAEYPGGKVDYSVIGEMTEHNPVFLIPGFTEGRFVTRKFAGPLHQEGDRQVIFHDQPVLNKKSKRKMPILDHHAEAVLAIIEQEGLGNRPVDFIAHSFGAIILAKAAELADERGLTCFKDETGSHIIFSAPAGTNHLENLGALAGRFLKFTYYEANPNPLKFGTFYTKQLDPEGKVLKAGQANAFADLSKTAREIGPLKEKESMYKRLGELGVKPYILGYSNDLLTPHSSREKTVTDNEQFIAGYSMPVDAGGKSFGAFSKSPSLKEFKVLTGLKGKAAKKAWIHHYLGAGHNDRLFHPERTVKAVLPILDGDLLTRVRQADKKFQKARQEKESKLRKTGITL